MSELNILTDLIDGFISGQTFEERWTAANKATENLGGVALNIAEIDDSSVAAKWLSSTMSDDWMSQYMSQEYYACDAVLDHCMGSYETFNFSTGNRISDPFASSNALQLDGDLYDFGYRSFFGGRAYISYYWQPHCDKHGLRYIRCTSRRPRISKSIQQSSSRDQRIYRLTL